MLHINFGFNWPSGFEKKIFENGGRRRGTPDHGHPISSPCEPNGSGELTICICENKGADQLRGNREADQRLCFRYLDSTIPPLLNSKISSF